MALSIQPLAQVKQLGPASTAGPTEQTYSTATAPAFVNSTTCTTGATACTTGFSPTNGNRLLVFAASDNATTAVSCSDAEGTGNTYTRDSDTSGAGGSAIRGGWFHTASTITGSGTYVITCSGTGANSFIGIIEYSGGTGGLAAVSVGTNPSALGVNSGTTINPSAFTTTDANTILVDGFANVTGGSVTITQTDATYTTNAGSCSTGATCFVGATGRKVVSSAASYSDGWTMTTGTLAGGVGAHAAYK